MTAAPNTDLTNSALAALRALAPLRAAADRARALPREGERIALVVPLLEAACVTAIADDDVDEAEHSAIRALVRALEVSSLDNAVTDAVIASSLDRTRQLGLPTRCDELGAQLARAKLGDAGVASAVLVAQISGGVSPPERTLLERLARAAGVTETALEAFIARTSEALAG